MAELTQAARDKYLEIDPDTKVRLFDVHRCLSCNGVHEVRPCPRIKRRVFSWNGERQLLTEEEFWPWDVWPHESVVWESDLFSDDDE